MPEKTALAEICPEEPALVNTGQERPKLDSHPSARLASVSVCHSHAEPYDAMESIDEGHPASRVSKMARTQ